MKKFLPVALLLVLSTPGLALTGSVFGDAEFLGTSVRVTDGSGTYISPIQQLDPGKVVEFIAVEAELEEGDITLLYEEVDQRGAVAHREEFTIKQGTHNYFIEKPTSSTRVRIVAELEGTATIREAAMHEKEANFLRRHSDKIILGLAFLTLVGLSFVAMLVRDKEGGGDIHQIKE